LCLVSVAFRHTVQRTAPSGLLTRLILQYSAIIRPTLELLTSYSGNFITGYDNTQGCTNFPEV